MGLIKHPVYTHVNVGHPQSWSSTDMPVATKQKLGDAHRVQRTGDLQMNVHRDFWVEESGLRGWGYGEEWRQQRRGEDGGHWDHVFGGDLLSVAPSFLFPGHHEESSFDPPFGLKRG